MAGHAFCAINYLLIDRLKLANKRHYFGLMLLTEGAICLWTLPTYLLAAREDFYHYFVDKPPSAAQIRQKIQREKRSQSSEFNEI